MVITFELFHKACGRFRVYPAVLVSLVPACFQPLVLSAQEYDDAYVTSVEEALDFARLASSEGLAAVYQMVAR